MGKKAVAELNPFDAIAVTAKPSASKTVKHVAKVTDKIKETVDRFVKNKAMIKSLEASQAQDEVAIIDHVLPQQEELARAGSFTKSLVVPGAKETLTFVTSDKFSDLKDKVIIDHVKDLLKEKYEENFVEVRTIALTDKIKDNKELINKIVKVVTSAGIPLQEAFVVVDAVRAKPDLDRRQFELIPNKLDTFRALVKQAKPSLK